VRRVLPGLREPQVHKVLQVLRAKRVRRVLLEPRVLSAHKELRVRIRLSQDLKARKAAKDPKVKLETQVHQVQTVTMVHLELMAHLVNLVLKEQPERKGKPAHRDRRVLKAQLVLTQQFKDRKARRVLRVLRVQ